MAIYDLSAQELITLIRNKPDELTMIDVREESEFHIIKLKGSKLIPLKELARRLDEIDWSKKVVFYCRSGVRSLSAAKLMEGRNDAFNLLGGIRSVFETGQKEYLEINQDEIGFYF